MIRPILGGLLLAGAAWTAARSYRRRAAHRRAVELVRYKTGVARRPLTDTELRAVAEQVEASNGVRFELADMHAILAQVEEEQPARGEP